MKKKKNGFQFIINFTETTSGRCVGVHATASYLYFPFSSFFFVTNNTFLTSTYSQRERKKNNRYNFFCSHIYTNKHNNITRFSIRFKDFYYTLLTFTTKRFITIHCTPFACFFFFLRDGT